MKTFYYELFDGHDSINEEKKSENHFPDDGKNQRNWKLHKTDSEAVDFLKKTYGEELMCVYTENKPFFKVLYENSIKDMV